VPKFELDMRKYMVDRFKAGDTQTKIARDLGISPATVRNYLRLAGVLGIVYGRRKSGGSLLPSLWS